MKLHLLILVHAFTASASLHERDEELRKIKVGPHPSYQSMTKVRSATDNVIELGGSEKSEADGVPKLKNELQAGSEEDPGRTEFAVQILHLFLTLLSFGPLTYTGFLDSKSVCLEHLDKSPLLMINLFTFILTLFHMVLLRADLQAIPYVALFALLCLRIIGLYILPILAGPEVCPVGMPSRPLFESITWEMFVYVPTVAQALIAAAWIVVTKIWPGT